MNQIYDMLPGPDARSPGAMLKNNPGSKKNSRFEELLKEHAKLGESGNSKNKELLEQMLGGQTCPFAWLQAFTLNQNLLELQAGQVQKALSGAAGAKPLSSGPGQISPSQVKGPYIAAQAVLSGGKVPGEKESGIKEPGIKESGIKESGIKEPGVKEPGIREPEAKEDTLISARKETIKSYKEASVMISPMAGMKAEAAGIQGENAPPGPPQSDKGTIPRQGEPAFSKSIKPARTLKHEKLTQEPASPKSHPFEQLRQNVKYSNQAAEPGRVREPIHETMPDIDKLSDSILKHVAQRAREFEITLHPRNLGSLLVKASYSEGKTVISLVCGEVKTAHAILQNAGDLADILQTRLGSPTEVVADVPRSADYLEHQNGGHKGREGTQQQPGQEDPREKSEDGEDFLQQLRLGLI